MARLVDRVRGTIDKYKMLESGDKVLVAVSGGPDSMFLLWVLDRIVGCKVELRVAHLNHCIRDRAWEDAAFVREQSGKLGIPCSTEEVDVRAYCRRNKLSLEEGARGLRYEFLSRVASEFGMTKIAMGHTATDQLETFILRVARGCGGRGLLLIPPKRQATIDKSIEIIRPLIEVSRDEICEFLDKKGISYCVDETNYDCSNVRNFVRHYIVPKLEELASDFSSKVNRLRDILDEEEEVLDRLSEDRLKEIQVTGYKVQGGIILDLAGFLETPLAIKRRILRKIQISKFKFQSSNFKAQNYPSYEEIENAIRYIENSSGGKEFDLSGIKIVKSSGKIKITDCKTESLEDYKLELPIPGEVEVNGYKIKSKVKSQKSKVRYDNNVEYFDLAKVKPPLMIRSMRIGDKIKLKIGNKKIKDVFIDNKVPVWERKNIPLLVDADGILWVIGHKRVNRALIGKDSNNVIKVWVES